MRIFIILAAACALMVGCSSPTEPPAPEPSIENVEVRFSNLIENHFTHVSISFTIQNGELDPDSSFWIYDDYYCENITSTNYEFDCTNGLYIGYSFQVMIQTIPTAHYNFDETHIIQPDGTWHD